MAFCQELRMQNCYLGYFVHDSEMPTFGQLGCGGFIVAGPDGQVLVTKSPPWTQYRDQALNWMIDLFRELRTKQIVEPRLEVSVQNPCADDTACAEDSNNFPVISRSLTADVQQIDKCLFELPPPVDVKSIDDEHGCLTELLINLSLARDLGSLQQALDFMERHFIHEESLLALAYDANGLGASKGHLAGAVLVGHQEDHHAMLDLARTELDRCRRSTTSDGVARPLEAVVSSTFLAELADRFRFHTREYDARLATLIRVDTCVQGDGLSDISVDCTPGAGSACGGFPSPHAPPRDKPARRAPGGVGGRGGEEVRKG